MHPKREPTEEMVKDSFSNSNVSGTLRVPLFSGGTRSVPDTMLVVQLGP